MPLQYFLYQRRKRQALINPDQMLSLNVPMLDASGQSADVM